MRFYAMRVFWISEKSLREWGGDVRKHFKRGSA